MQRILGAIAILSMGAIASANAQDFGEDDFAARTAGQVADLCAAADESALDRYALGFCYGWLEGVGQFYEQAVADGTIAEQKVACPGKELSRKEWADVLVGWVGADPARRDLTPLKALGDAAKETFPCP